MKRVDDMVLAEEQMRAVETILNDILQTILYAITMATITASTIKRIDPKLFTKEASSELRLLSKSYTKIAKLGPPKDLTKADPVLIRKAVELLEIVP